MNGGIDAGTLYVCAQEREPVACLSSSRLARRASDFLLFSRLEREIKRARGREEGIARSLNFLDVASP